MRLPVVPALAPGRPMAPGLLRCGGVIVILALAACSPAPLRALTARHSWHPSMTVTAVHCGRLERGVRGLSYRFTNGGSAPAGPVVVARFSFSRAPGTGVTGEGVTAAVSIVAPGHQGTGVVLASAGTEFDECQITSWRVAEVVRR